MQMSDAMVDAKLDDDVRIGPSHYTYPSMEKMFGAYNAEISFRINKQTDISIEGGLLDRFTVKGASNKDDGVRLFLENKVHHLKLQFLYHATQKSTFQIGPSLTFISTEDQRHQAFNYLAKTSKVLPGASVGYKFDLIDTPVFFVSFLVNGNYVFSTEMGPFYAHGSFVFPDFDDPVKYNPSAINFSSATIMLGAGIKIF